MYGFCYYLQLQSLDCIVCGVSAIHKVKRSIDYTEILIICNIKELWANELENFFISKTVRIILEV